MSELLQGQMFPDDADGSTSSPEGFRVRTSPLPGRATDSTVIGRRSSLRSPDLLARSDQIGSSLRTCLRSASEAAIGCSLNWTDSGTPGGRAWWVLGRSGRRTSGTGCGSSGDGWPTPRTLTGGPESAERKQELGRTESGGGDLASAVQASWPTPRSEDSEQTGAHAGVTDTLTSKARQDWPTPNASDVKGASQPEGRRPVCDDDLPSRVARQDWFTPQGRDWKDTGPSQGNRKDINLGVQAHRCAGPPAPESPSTTGKRRDWHTPRAQEDQSSTEAAATRMTKPDTKSTTGGPHYGPQGLTQQARTTNGAGQLNPAWVESLQGLPAGWIDVF